MKDTAILWRAGDLRPHWSGCLFACATESAARSWADALRRPQESVQAFVVDASRLCVVNTHGYVEADWGAYGPKEVSTYSKARVFRVVMPLGEAVEVLNMLAGDPDYGIAHEIVWLP
jgi:hypothetical protein